MVTSDINATVHYCFTVMHEEVKEARKRREIEEAQDRLEQIRQSHNTEYERALKAWVSSDVKSLVHYMFSVWRDMQREAVRQREIDAAEERLAKMQNTHYERALKLMVTSDINATVHYCFTVMHEEVKEARKRREIEEAQDRLEQIRQSHNMEYERALQA